MTEPLSATHANAPPAPARVRFRDGLLAARAHVVFLLGLASALALVVAIERPRLAPVASDAVRALGPVPRTATAPLTPTERNWAAIAWRYFERNTQPATGLVNSVDGYPAASMWDIGSALLATVAAERLGLLSRGELDARLGRALTSLASLPLFDDALPNKSYDTATLTPVNYDGTPAPRGVGWSAIDLGRMLVAFDAIVWGYPELTPQVRAVLARWRLDRLTRDGLLIGARVGADQRTELLQEGRLGYEQYAARALALLGADVDVASRYDANLAYVEVEGIGVPGDARTAARYGAHTYVLSEPYLLDGLELGWDRDSEALAYRVYRAQEARHERTGVLTAVSEDHIDRPPYFVYNAVAADGRPWAAITDSGADASPHRSLSTKAAFGWWALLDTPYAVELLRAVASSYDPERGWYAGVYEQDRAPNTAVAANTNAVILESLAYRQFGPLLAAARRPEAP